MYHLTTWTDPEGTMPSEIKSEKEKDKYCVISLIRGIEKNPNSEEHSSDSRFPEAEDRPWENWVKAV